MSNSADSQKHSKSTKNDIDTAVAGLLKKIDYTPDSISAIFADLKKKYGDDEIIEKIMEEYRKKMKETRKFASKIKERLMYKHPNLTMKEYIEKISKYQERYKLTNEQIQTIINLIFSNKEAEPAGDGFDIGYNQMAKTLGFVPASYNLSEGLQIKEHELAQLDEIIALNKMSKELHNQVTLQSLIYADCDDVAINNDFDKNKINTFSYVHPVIFALFFPKHDILDSHMIRGSISEIVKGKKEGYAINTQSNYELYWDISTDPNETACTSKQNPVTDLLYRTAVQIELWKNVLNMRQGKYYTTDLNAFLTAIDNCKSNVFDAADLVNIKDEGTVIRKLFGAFSLRPIIVMTYPTSFALSSDLVSTSHLSSINTTHLTTLPLVTVRIPVDNGLPTASSSSSTSTSTISLGHATEQNQLYFHHGRITFKKQQILYARELLVFYVHRKLSTVNISRMANPYSISFIPFAAGMQERINETQIEFNDTIEIGNSRSAKQKFGLSAVIYIESTKIDPFICKSECDTSRPIKNHIIGCGTYVNLTVPPAVSDPPSSTTNMRRTVFTGRDKSLSAQWIKYSPIQIKASAIKPLEFLENLGGGSGSHITNSSGIPSEATHQQIIEKHGSIYIYRSCDNMGLSI